MLQPIESIGIPDVPPRSRMTAPLPEYEVVLRFKAHTVAEARLVAYSLKRNLREGELRALGVVR
jgi:hypothetical protein